MGCSIIKVSQFQLGGVSPLSFLVLPPTNLFYRTLWTSSCCQPDSRRQGWTPPSLSSPPPTFPAVDCHHPPAVSQAQGGDREDTRYVEKKFVPVYLTEEHLLPHLLHHQHPLRHPTVHFLLLPAKLELTGIGWGVDGWSLSFCT